MDKRIGLILVLSMGITIMGGCSNSNMGSDSNVIEYSSMWKEGEPQATWLKNTVAAFEKETGVKVKLTLAGRDVLTKEKSRIIMKNPPDVIDQDINEITAALLNKKILAEPLDDLYSSKGPEGQSRLLDIFPENLINLYKKDGKSYFIPYEFVTSLFMYDKGMINEIGMTAPKTWDEFIKIGDKLREKGIAPLALDGNVYGYNAYYYCWLVERVMGPGNFAKVAKDTTGASWDDKGYLKAAQYVAQISKAQKDFFQKGYEISNYPKGQAYWAQGNAGSILCGTWIPVETAKQVKADFEYQFYSFPEVSGGVGKTTDVEALLIGCSIPKGAKNATRAKELLKFMVNKVNATKFAKDTTSISSRIDVEYPQKLAAIKPIVKAAENFFKPYDGVMSDAPEWFANVFYPLDNKLVFGEITPEDFIKQIKQKSINYYKNIN
jgi:ABC-type glycerol-3-phosphate transport system substrate-binding protein